MSGVEAAIGFGASVLGIASAGISVASTLMRFSASYKSSAEKIEDLSSRVSLTATILTTVGNTIENHKDYFKEDDFRGKFGRVTERCKKDYGLLGQALSKARSEVEELASERERKVRKMTPWRKLIWALGGEERMRDLQSSLEESKSQVLMMQSAASLVVLQILGRRRALTEDENNDLSELKLKMGLLLAALQEAKLLPPAPTKMSKRRVRRDSTPHEVVVIMEGETQNLSFPRVEDNGGTGEQRNREDVVVTRERAAPSPTVEEDRSTGKDRYRERVVHEVNPETGRAKSSSRSSLIIEDRTTAPEKDRPHVDSTRQPFYEAWAIHTRPPRKLRTVGVLGLKIKIRDDHSGDFDYFFGIAATQNEIARILAQLDSASCPSDKSSSTLQQLTALSPQNAATISHIISGRINATKLPVPRTWAIELLMPWSSITKSALGKSGLSTILNNKTNSRTNIGYLLILRSPDTSVETKPRSADQVVVPRRDFNPFRENWSTGAQRPGLLSYGEAELLSYGGAPPPPPAGQVPPSPPSVLIEAARGRSGHGVTEDHIVNRAGRPVKAGGLARRHHSSSPSLRWPPPPIPPSERVSPRYREVITQHRGTPHEYDDLINVPEIGYGGSGSEDEEEKVQAQKSAETAVNDFLATFSTLYDDVSPEERTKVLDSVAMPEQGEQSGSESEEEYVSRRIPRSEESSSIGSYSNIL